MIIETTGRFTSLSMTPWCLAVWGPQVNQNSLLDGFFFFFVQNTRLGFFNQDQKLEKSFYHLLFGKQK
jgi:hypothetical protein